MAEAGLAEGRGADGPENCFKEERGEVYVAILWRTAATEPYMR